MNFRSLQAKTAAVSSPDLLADDYDPAGEPLNADDCPLNANEDITGVCGRCRRCFDGTAVARGREMLPVLSEHI